jgi:hypothetical protein
MLYQLPAPAAVPVRAIREGSQLQFADDFSAATIPWIKTLGGITLTKDTVFFSTGGGSMKIVTSAVNSETSELHRILPAFPVATPVVAGTAGPGIVTFGGMVAFTDQNAANMGIYVGWRDGVNWYRGKLLVTLAAGKSVQYDAGQSGGASLQTLTSRAFGIQAAYPNWHRFEITVDFKQKHYLDATFDDLNFASVVQGTALRQAADATLPFMYDFALDVTNQAAAVASTIYVDNLYAFQSA